MRSRVLLVVAWFMVDLSYGADFVVDGSSIRAPISSRDYNRVSFSDDKINQAFFKASEFLIKLDEINGQLFILPRNKSSKHPLSMTVTSVGKLTQQFFFVPKDIGSQSIVLSSPPAPKIVRTEDSRLEGLIYKLIKRTVKINKTSKSVFVEKGWKFKRLGVARFDGFIGHILTLKNVSGKSKKVTAKMLWRSNTRAISIVENELSDLGETTVYMISEGGF